MKFTENNYFLKSKGNFDFIENIDANEIFTIKPKRKRYFKTKKEMIEALAKILNITDANEIKKIKLNHISPLHWFWDEVTSIYFTYNDKIIRISNHWSQFINGKNKAITKDYKNTCGYIRSCWWNLKFKGKNLRKLQNNKSFFKLNYSIGIISLKNLEEIKLK